jgi:1,3-beta-galactosyl-N-acetylhexosamine phosphorylase
MGVQKEVGQTMGALAVEARHCKSHFVTEGLEGHCQTEVGKSYVYACRADTTILHTHDNGHITLATHAFGGGRSVYLSALPYSPGNSRLLHRILFWVAQKESEMLRSYSDNLNTECAIYPETGHAVVINNSDRKQATTFYDIQGNAKDITLSSYESQWFNV